MHKIPLKSTRFDLHLPASLFWHLAALVYLTAVTTLLFEPLGFHPGKTNFFVFLMCLGGLRQPLPFSPLEKSGIKDRLIKPG